MFQLFYHFIIDGYYMTLACNCVILSTNKGGQINFSDI